MSRPDDEREAEHVLRFEADGGRYCYVLLGRRGSVQFAYMAMPGELGMMETTPGFLMTDLGFHSPEPMFDGQDPMTPRGCERLPPHLQSGPCFYDGSGLQPMKIGERLWLEGARPRTMPYAEMGQPERKWEHGIHEALVAYYHQVFYEWYDGPHTPGTYRSREERRAELDAALTELPGDWDRSLAGLLEERKDSPDTTE